MTISSVNLSPNNVKKGANAYITIQANFGKIIAIAIALSDSV